MNPRSASAILWVWLAAFAIAVGLSGCGPRPEDTRTVCEWVIMEHKIQEAHVTVDQAIDRLTDATASHTTPRVMMTAMERAIRDLRQEYETLQGKVGDMRSDFESPIVLTALTDVERELGHTQDALGRCIEVFDYAAGDVDRLMTREHEISAAIDRMLRSAETIMSLEAQADMLECARRILADLS